MRRVFGGDQNFLAWSLPLFTFQRIRVRIHLLFVIYIVIELIKSMQHGSLGFTYQAIIMGTLFLVVLIHEFGHCFACRWVGGEANEVLMWPLGGLAMCSPPHHPRAALITTLGGPATHLVMGPIYAGALLALGAPASVLAFRPIDPLGSLGLLQSGGNALFWVKFAFFAAFTTNAYLFCFNMLLVMFPMDAGRVLQEILWFRLGYRQSMKIAVNLGFYLAILLGIFSLMYRDAPMLFGIAFFCGFTCWQERRNLAMIEPEGYGGGYEFPSAYKTRSERGRGVGEGAVATSVRTGPSKAELKRKQEEADTQAEVDRILEKIRTAGMGSLTKKEKDTLRGETERKRRQAAGE
jgi:Zn-dependent protease